MYIKTLKRLPTNQFAAHSISQQANRGMLTKEHSHMGKVSLYSWSTVLQVWIQRHHYIQITTYFGQVQSSSTGDRPAVQ